MKQSEALRQILMMVLKSGIRPEMTPKEWLGIIFYCHKKGWLYGKYEDEKVKVAAVAYRIKDFNEKEYQEAKTFILPEKEEGRILFVPFIVSKDKDVFKIKKSTTQFLKLNPDITEIVFEDRNNRIKRFKVNKEKT